MPPTPPLPTDEPRRQFDYTNPATTQFGSDSECSPRGVRPVDFNPARLQHRRELGSNSHHLLTTLFVPHRATTAYGTDGRAVSPWIRISHPNLWCHDHRCNPSVSPSSRLNGEIRSAADSRLQRSLSSTSSCIVSMDEHSQEYLNLNAVADARQREMMHIPKLNPNIVITSKT